MGETRTLVFQAVHEDTRGVKYRAYFKEGGYADHDDFMIAQRAFSPMRGPVVRIDRIEQVTLWLAGDLQEES